MVKCFACCYAVAFVVSVGVHILTYFPSALFPAKQSAVFILAFFGLHLTSLAAAIVVVVSYVIINSQSRKEERPIRLWPQLLQWVPRPLILLCGMLMCYSFVNGLLFVGRMEGGAPAERDGHYYLQNHGKVLRQLDRHEFDRFRAYEVRAFSGVWMLATYLPAVYFWYICPAAQAEYSMQSEFDPLDDW